MELDLQELGLSLDESKVYLALLETGGGAVSVIAKRAGKNRSTCYYTLASLLRQGLVSRIERKGRLYYSPENPTKLIQLAERRMNLVNDLVPNLLALHTSRSNKPRIRYFEGRGGIETIFEDALTATDEILGYTNFELMIDLIPDQFKHFTEQKLSRRISTRYLSPYSQRGEKLVEQLVPEGFRRALFEVLFINPQQFPFQNDIALYEGRIALMSISRGEFTGMLIESENSYVTMRSIFDLAWLGATSFVAT